MKSKVKKERNFTKATTNSPVRAKKHLGQHFLIDESIAEKIGKTLSFQDYSEVLEIGPGTGVLTKYLLKNNIRLTAMDLDRESIAYLEEHFSTKVSEQNNFRIVEADFLKCDLSQLFGTKEFAITGNFPYNISTQIVFKMLEYRQQIPEFSGMFQKEVAQRICEPAGSKTYGILSVLVQAFYEAEYLFTVKPEVFNPPPKVESGVLRLIRKENFQLECDEKLFFRVVKTAFQQRRKTLWNSLKAFNISEDLKEDSIFAKRPEQLDVAQFIRLTKKIAHDAVSNR
ncbi:MAG TPA: 16S rRNA (adenine(1518)-N(6)/adenine(1519)-N(6))-dimethyltransferase RsmA [Flavobacteriaceae bacterium]|nr:16S rRNA (adenine(1518)-N(6)/adenine(1519)-N(6))-dimethyltransferase RsmA [Flavobacteriaceae bacterium]